VLCGTAARTRADPAARSLGTPSPPCGAMWRPVPEARRLAARGRARPRARRSARRRDLGPAGWGGLIGDGMTFANSGRRGRHPHRAPGITPHAAALRGGASTPACAAGF